MDHRRASILKNRVLWSLGFKDIQLPSPNHFRDDLRKTRRAGNSGRRRQEADGKLFSPLWTDFLPLGQKCHFRPFPWVFKPCSLDTLGPQVTQFLARSKQVGVSKSLTATP